MLPRGCFTTQPCLKTIPSRLGCSTPSWAYPNGLSTKDESDQINVTVAKAMIILCWKQPKLQGWVMHFHADIGRMGGNCSSAVCGYVLALLMREIFGFVRGYLKIF